jgi:hypothetical protein
MATLALLTPLGTTPTEGKHQAMVGTPVGQERGPGAGHSAAGRQHTALHKTAVGLLLGPAPWQFGTMFGDQLLPGLHGGMAQRETAILHHPGIEADLCAFVFFCVSRNDRISHLYLYHPTLFLHNANNK